MKELETGEVQKYKVFLVALICSGLLFFPAYIHFYNLTQADLFCNTHVENPVLSNHLASLEKKWVGVSCMDRSLMLFDKTIFVLPLASFQTLSPVERSSPMRC